MKRIIQILIGLLAICIIGILYISYLTNHNHDQILALEKKIKTNYNISDDITNINQYGNYYTITTTNHIIVLNKEFQEILKEDISILKKNPNHYTLIYKTNKLMYEKTILKENNLTYEYYDATTGELIKTTTMERQ